MSIINFDLFFIHKLPRTKTERNLVLEKVRYYLNKNQIIDIMSTSNFITNPSMPQKHRVLSMRMSANSYNTYRMIRRSVM